MFAYYKKGKYPFREGLFPDRNIRWIPMYCEHKSWTFGKKDTENVGIQEN